MPSRSRSGRGSKGSSGSTTSTADDSPSTSSSSVTTKTKNNRAETEATLFSKVVRRTGGNLTPEEALAAAHWIRQGLAIVIGMIFGVARLKGFPPVMTYCVLAFTGPHSILSALHELDLDEIATKGSLQSEGFFPATALFFLSWIIFHTIFLPAAS